MALNRGQIHNLFQEWIVEKSEKKYEALYDYTFDMVSKFAFMYLHNKKQAKEFADEIFVMIYNAERSRLPKFDEANWLYQLVKEECIEFLKETQKNEFDIAKVFLVTEDDEDVKSLVDIVNYNYAIYSNKPKYQEIIALEFLGEFSEEDISYILKLKPNKTKFMIHFSNRWAKIGMECFAFFIVASLVFLISLLLKNPLDNTYIIPIALFFVGGVFSEFVAYNSRDLRPLEAKKKKKE